MEAVALFNFDTTQPDELSFKAGMVLKVLNMDEDKNWYKAEMNGRQGFVPSTYIQLKPYCWFKGKITRAKAEEVLQTQTLDGSFLVRESESSPGQIQHFKVLRDYGGQYFLWEEKFNSLNQLISHHRSVSVSKTETIFLRQMTEKTKQQMKARALYDFTPQEEGELLLKRGDLITVTDSSDCNWWRGHCRGVQGMFPKAYVSEEPPMS